MTDGSTPALDAMARLPLKPVSINALMASIEAMIIEQEVLVRRIDKVTLSVDNEELLSERVLWIDEAIGELMAHYEVAREGSRTYLHVSDFIKACEQQIDVLLAVGDQPTSTSPAPALRDEG